MSPRNNLHMIMIQFIDTCLTILEEEISPWAVESPYLFTKNKRANFSELLLLHKSLFGECDHGGRFCGRSTLSREA